MNHNQGYLTISTAEELKITYLSVVGVLEVYVSMTRMQVSYAVKQSLNLLAYNASVSFFQSVPGVTGLHV